MPSFGPSFGDGNGAEAIEGAIKGSRAFAPGSGTGISMTARVEASTILHNIKCALYDWDTKNLIPNGITEQIAMNTAGVFVWQTFKFDPSNQPEIVSGKEYLLVAWAGGGAGTASLKDYTTGGYGWRDDDGYVDGSYIGFPDPTVLDPSSDDNLYCIYCTYEEAGGLTLTLPPSPKGGTGKASMLGSVGGCSFGG